MPHHKPSADRTRPTIIAGNWKMNLSPGEAIAFFGDLLPLIKHEAHAQVKRVVFPVAYCLGSNVHQVAAKVGIELGAQNIHWEEKGAFTGELSGTGLKLLGIHWALIGHSERRQYFGESDATAAKRLALAINQNFNVVYCIGERLQEREAGQTETVLKTQLQSFITTIKSHPPGRDQIISIAYEPVWAIGTGKTATPDQAQQAHGFIRQELKSALGAEQATHTALLYGGSVTPENCQQLLALADVDGVLVGGASLKPEGFAKILTAGDQSANKA